MHHRTTVIGRPSSLTACGHRSRGTRALRAVIGAVATVPRHARHEHHRHHHHQAASQRCQARLITSVKAPPCMPRQRYWETQPPHCARPTLTKEHGPSERSSSSPSIPTASGSSCRSPHCRSTFIVCGLQLSTIVCSTHGTVQICRNVYHAPIPRPLGGTSAKRSSLALTPSRR